MTRWPVAWSIQSVFDSPPLASACSVGSAGCAAKLIASTTVPSSENKKVERFMDGPAFANDASIASSFPDRSASDGCLHSRRSRSGLGKMTLPTHGLLLRLFHLNRINVRRPVHVGA